ncbi:hypothetical protein CTAYLR_003037 [Chrysophaeum taylorii]|uniref:G domain-containing protein n=1 Tax=Chrysophaeum taylorii TaxID=2483200 RepID=A0AAD7U5I7_9STRA|nr:hypothetical protein CTAYLR_003037 [Chrysophaeum taylorii]
MVFVFFARARALRSCVRHVRSTSVVGRIRVVDVGDDDDEMASRIRAAERGQVVGLYEAPEEEEAPSFRVEDHHHRIRVVGDDDDDDEMASRIRAAERGQVVGLYEAREEAEAPSFRVDVAPGHCPGCGVRFQREKGLGYLPPHLEGGGEDVVCERCHSLRHKGITDARGDIAPKDLEKLVNPRGLVVMFVDLFDIKTFSFPRRAILVANKVDLLPSDASRSRVKQFVRGKFRPRDVYLVSCKTGEGVGALVERLKRERGPIYVCGAANSGKSTFINRVVGAFRGGGKKRGDRPWGLTASGIPGTTMGLIRVTSDLDFYDTPGIFSESSLNSEELKSVLPQKRIEPRCLRVGRGSIVWIGALANVEVVEGKPMLLTFFQSDKVTLHQGKNFDVETHVGTLVKPPFSIERYREIPRDTFVFDVEGVGFDRAAKDVVLSGIGWFSVTGSGACRLRVRAPAADLRDPLLPFEAKNAASKFTGGRVLKQQQQQRRSRSKR